ncbi:Peptidyl-prolyl cis-trans isomerase [Candidatus Nitrotoga sp. BS]|uniref:FKBP-type peptidyl-prolyl cis-trans isomerase n=1 Tax=Candidatus Nitrotoga sp. BS TaxID=2890408 RepID=UPI001F9624AD|nr:Peptidyl-prolyl cis-trans isomerase [Candidatus Nitrotoga sp. BS]
MHNIKALLFSGAFILPMVLPTQNAFSATESAATAVTKLIKIDHKVGDGKEAVAGKTVDVHYTGWLYNATAPSNKGSKFDSSRDRRAHFSFPLGAGRVIKGWDQGVAGMKVGGQRTLIIPADMGYGERGAGSAIPPNAALVFDVELFGVH